jgi:hypothetical protein
MASGKARQPLLRLHIGGRCVNWDVVEVEETPTSATEKDAKPLFVYFNAEHSYIITKL